MCVVEVDDLAGRSVQLPNHELRESERGPARRGKFGQLDDTAKALLQAATQRLNRSARAFHRILKVSRTIADLEGAGEIEGEQLDEALQYRSRGLVR